MRELFNKIKANYKIVQEYLAKNENNVYFALSIFTSLNLITFWESNKYILMHTHNFILILFCLMLFFNIAMYVCCFDIRLTILLTIELKEIQESIVRNNAIIKEYEARIKVLENIEEILSGDFTVIGDKK